MCRQFVVTILFLPEALLLCRVRCKFEPAPLRAPKNVLLRHKVSCCFRESTTCNGRWRELCRVRHTYLQPAQRTLSFPRKKNYWLSYVIVFFLRCILILAKFNLLKHSGRIFVQVFLFACVCSVELRTTRRFHVTCTYVMLRIHKCDSYSKRCVQKVNDSTHVKSLETNAKKPSATTGRQIKFIRVVLKGDISSATYAEYSSFLATFDDIEQLQVPKLLNSNY